MFRGNKIYKIENGRKKRVFFIPGLRVSFKGKNSVVEVGYPYPKFSGCKIKIGHNCTVSIGTSLNKIRAMTIFADGENSNVIIGDNFSATKELAIHAAYRTCKIGNNCMFGRNIILRCTDGHTVIIDGEVANKPDNIEIGNKVWLADDVSIFKGVKISDNCIVGTKSLVTHSLEHSDFLYAGIPAKCIKKISGWKREAPL